MHGLYPHRRDCFTLLGLADTGVGGQTSSTSKIALSLVGVREGAVATSSGTGDSIQDDKSCNEDSNIETVSLDAGTL